MALSKSVTQPTQTTQQTQAPQSDTIKALFTLLADSVRHYSGKTGEMSLSDMVAATGGGTESDYDTAVKALGDNARKVGGGSEQMTVSQIAAVFNEHTNVNSGNRVVDGSVAYSGTMAMGYFHGDGFKLQIDKIPSGNTPFYVTATVNNLGGLGDNYINIKSIISLALYDLNGKQIPFSESNGDTQYVFHPESVKANGNDSINVKIKIPGTVAGPSVIVDITGWYSGTSPVLTKAVLSNS